ncbi:MAG: hypothetical protein CSA03_01640 [Bacteroidetes bacterium]|nr:MAG: hypothetical protein CSA03_01640 [Bacteroidota bacterium]
MGSTFLRRLKFYGIGFGLGLVFVFFFFQNRGCSWLPGNRVKNTILDRVMVVSDETIQAFEEKGLTKEIAFDALNDGDVLFTESDKNNDSKVYAVEYEGHKFLYTLPYESFVTEVKLGGDPNKMETSTTGMGTIWRFPVDENLIYIDTSSVLDCQMKQLNLKDAKAVFKKIKASGKLDFERTDFDIEPKPEHVLVFTSDSLQVSVKTIWYKDKIEVLSFEFPSEVKCP